MGHPSLKGPRGLLLFVGTAVVSWLVYVTVASSIAESRLRAVASRMDLTIDHVRVRSWLPGRLVLDHLVVSHSLLGSRCRTTFASVDLPHHPLRLVVGELHISTLTADRVGMVCEFGAEAPPPMVARAKSSIRLSRELTTLAMVVSDASASDASATDASTADGSIEIERAVVRVEGVSIGGATLVEAFEFRANGFAVAHDGVRLDHAEAKLESASVTYKEQTLLDNLTLSLRVFSAEGGTGTEVGRELRAVLAIQKADVRGLPGIGAETPTSVRGTLQAELTSRDARLSSGSSLHLSLHPFVWNHEDGSVTRFKKPLVVSAEVLPPSDSRSKSVQWQASMPSVQYQAVRYQGGAAMGATMHDVVAQVRYETESVLPTDQPPEVTLRAASVSSSRDDQVLTADTVTVQGRLRNRTGSAQPQLFDSAVIKLAGARLVRALSPDEQPSNDRFSAEVHLKAMRTKRGYAGDVSMRGNDAGMLLTLMNSDELPSWVTSKFDHEPFSLEAALEMQDGSVRVSGLQLERGALSFRGWWQVDGEHSNGALLMDYGGLQVSIGGGQTGELVMRSSEE